jgi:hypothetical protein
MSPENFAATYYLNRLRNLVFGAWLNWTQEQLSLQEEEYHQIDSQRRSNQLICAINSLDVFTKSQYQINKQNRRADLFCYFFKVKSGISNLIQNVKTCKQYCFKLENDFLLNQTIYLDEMRSMHIRHCFGKMKRKTLRRLKRSRKQHLIYKGTIADAFKILKHFVLKSQENNTVYQESVKYSEERRLKRRLCTPSLI